MIKIKNKNESIDSYDSLEIEGDDEKSMEEILNSIRGIIDNKDSSDSLVDEDILELTQLVNEVDKKEIDSDDFYQNEESQPFDEDLVSEETIAQSTDSIQKLLDNIKVDNIKNSSNNLSLENLVLESIKPALAHWLNENLSTIVKNTVDKEIKKLIIQKKDYL